MLYRETGQFRTSYAADHAILPIRQDRIGLAIILVVAFLVVPLASSHYWLSTIMLPFLIFSLAALGLNILTGYAGQLSLGTGGFMACGAFAAFKLTTSFPELNIVVVFVLAGLITAGVGILFGIPSLRIKGFYLAVATLAAQFFLVWLFNKLPWFTNYSPSGVISAPPRAVFGDFYVTGAQATSEAKYLFTLTAVVLLALAAKNMTRCRIGRSWMAIRDMDIAAEIIGIRPLTAKLSAFAISSFYIGIAGAQATLEAKYLFTLTFVALLALAAKNMTRCRIGRSWMAIRDMDIAAEIIGIRPLTAKLSAFAISSFYIGIAGALWAFTYTSSVEALAFQIDRSFQILFMIIIGGLGSILGSFLGAAFIVLLPIFLNNAPALFGMNMPTDLVTHVEFMIFGALIIFFLIVEPHGLARLWQIGKEKLRRWPFPY